MANAPAAAEIERLVEVAHGEQEEAEWRNPALRAARVADEREAFARIWRELAASPNAEQLATTGSLVDPSGYEREPEAPQRTLCACRRCGREGPWLQVCGPCGDPGPFPGCAVVGPEPLPHPR